MSAEPEIEQRMAAADRALAARNPIEARAILEVAVVQSPQDTAFWQRLATVRQACGATGQALAAIEKALELAPLHFVNLLMRLARGSGTAGLAAPRPVGAVARGRVHLRPLLTLKKGDIVAALIDGETTLKRYLVEKGKPFLRAENADFPDLIPAQELIIQGVLIALMRQAA